LSSPLSQEELERRALELRWVLSDVDGVLTDGRLYYGKSGEDLKVFDVKDGLAVAMARRVGLQVGILTARRSAALEQRARELGLEEVITGRRDKGAAFDELLARRDVEARQVAYLGDDLTDLPVLERAGLSLAPADAAAEVRQRVHVTLATAGGRGALRETMETLLRARGQWQEVVASFSAGEGVPRTAP
jgi:3-deoxy-D-manno-octulosonate 8-phosphate phosphatase (KDO 8-P phosphatase)